MEKKSTELMRTVVRSHAHAVESNLSENLHLLQLTAESNPLDEIRRLERLTALFDTLNRSSGGKFIDLGVIDEEGNHLAYVGPQIR
jgi:two-component system NtrC family sensor kinase